MRYSEPREKSAELLRLALARMGRHTAAYNPLTFTLWYEVVSGTNPRLTAAVQALQQQGRSIDDAQVLTLCRAHVFPPDEASMDRIRDEMQQLMHAVQRSADDTSVNAGHYGAQLGALSAVLEAGGDSSALQPQVSDVLASTARMRQSVDDLRQQVDASQKEVERLRLALDRVRSEALIDPLTGVLNRKGFEQKLHAMLEKRPSEGTSHVLVMLDIDHFKKINDTHGHVVGDRVIEGMGEILRNTIRGPIGTAARYGGEEFAILFPQARLEDSRQVTEAVRARTKALRIRSRQTQEVLSTVTVSGGVASWRPGDAPEDLVARADAALYQSKQAGRDRITLA